MSLHSKLLILLLNKILFYAQIKEIFQRTRKCWTFFAFLFCTSTFLKFSIGEEAKGVNPHSPPPPPRIRQWLYLYFYMYVLKLHIKQLLRTWASLTYYSGYSYKIWFYDSMNLLILASHSLFLYRLCKTFCNFNHSINQGKTRLSVM